MNGTIVTSWAIPLDFAQAASRIEAYVEARTSIKSFQKCIELSATEDSSIGRLPQELFDFIGRKLENDIFHNGKKTKPRRVCSRKPQDQGLLAEWKREVTCVRG